MLGCKAGATSEFQPRCLLLILRYWWCGFPLGFTREHVDFVWWMGMFATGPQWKTFLFWKQPPWPLHLRESEVSEESSGPRWTWADFGRGWSFAFFNLIRVNDSAFFATLCIFITVSSTLGKGREGRNSSSSSSILWAKEENKRMGQRTG